MAKTEAAPVVEAPALPDLDSIGSVAIDSLASVPKRAPLTDAENALAAAIIERGSNGNAAVGPKLADRKAANAAAARMRRLVNSYQEAQGTPKAKLPAITTRVVAKDGGSAWALSFTPVELSPETPVETATETPVSAS